MLSIFQILKSYYKLDQHKIFYFTNIDLVLGCLTGVHSQVILLCFQISSVQDGIYVLEKAHFSLHPISQKFPQCCLWNGSSVRLIDESPLLSFQERSPSTSSFNTSLLQVISCVMSLALCLLVVSQASQQPSCQPLSSLFCPTALLSGQHPPSFVLHLSCQPLSLFSPTLFSAPSFIPTFTT